MGQRPGGELEHRGKPCVKCPWQADANLTDFSDADFDKLQAANGCRGAEAPVTAPMMACHLDQPDTAHPMRLCAGYLAVVGRDHLGVRLKVMAGCRRPFSSLVWGGRRCTSRWT
jgi:hypothetical protein